METKIHSKFPKDIWVTKIEELTKLNVTGAIFYTDGGSRNVQFKARSGWGIHSYFFNAEKPEGIGGYNLDYPTHHGYSLKAEALKENIVNVVKINNIYGNCGAKTSQVAEMEGFIQAALIYIETGLYKLCKTLTIRTDSRYVKDGIVDYLDTWIKNDWRKADGSIVKNLMYWKEIKRITEVINDLGCVLDIDWVKGHIDYGNIIADQMATLGLFQDTLYGEEFVEPKPYNDSSVDFCPLLLDTKLMYYPNVLSNRDGKFYYMTYSNSNNTDDINETGRNLIDASISVVATDIEQFALAEYLQRCVELDEVVGVSPKAIDLNLITKPKVQIEVSTDNITALNRKVSKKDIKVESTSEKTLITILNPPRTADFTRQRMEDLLSTFRILESGKDETIIETDITDLLFDKEVNGKGITKYKFKVSEATSLQIKAPIWKEGGVSDYNFELTFGLDLPRRRVFSNVKDVNPKVSIFTWYESEIISCFATIVRIDGAIGIWTAENTNTVQTGAFDYDK